MSRMVEYIVLMIRKNRMWQTVIVLCSLFLIIVGTVTIYGYVKPLPEGISYEGEIETAQDIEFLYDLTFTNAGETQRDQMIFDRMYEAIEDAEEFVVLDMFLFNDEYDRSMAYPTLSHHLAHTLIQKKQESSDMDMMVITDRINTFYGSYTSDVVSQLEDHGIHVVFTDVRRLRDSNPVYSGFWRTLFQWFDTSAEKKWLPNPFSTDSPDVTLQSFTELLNFKANHRKLLVTEKEGIITSANPHDASAYHSNIGLVVKGDILYDLLESEQAVATMSGADVEWFESLDVQSSSPTEAPYEVQLLTEGKIKDHLLEEIKATKEKDRITMGAFYLSDRDVMEHLIQAAHRGVEVKLILDPNKDAFGREKKGIPNRPVAHELVTKSDGNINVRWYDTNGEQYHPKMLLIETENRDILIGGSANFTKRNLGDFNLETDLKITAAPNVGVMTEVKEYFQTIWENEGATYTENYKTFADDSFFNYYLYRFQEWSGISTF